LIGLEIIGIDNWARTKKDAEFFYQAFIRDSLSVLISCHQNTLATVSILIALKKSQPANNSGLMILFLHFSSIRELIVLLAEFMVKIFGG